MASALSSLIARAGDPDLTGDMILAALLADIGRGTLEYAEFRGVITLVFPEPADGDDQFVEPLTAAQVGKVLQAICAALAVESLYEYPVPVEDVRAAELPLAPQLPAALLDAAVADGIAGQMPGFAEGMRRVQTVHILFCLAGLALTQLEGDGSEGEALQPAEWRELRTRLDAACASCDRAVTAMAYQTPSGDIWLQMVRVAEAMRSQIARMVP